MISGQKLADATNTLQEKGLKISPIKGTEQLRTEFPRGYYVSIGKHVALELAELIKNNPQIDADRISEYFRARIFYGPAVANSMLDVPKSPARKPA